MNTHAHTRYIITSLIFLLIPYCVSAQRTKSTRTAKLSETEILLRAYTDSIKHYRMMADSLILVNDSLREANGMKVESKYFTLFSPLTFQHQVAGRSLKLNNDTIASVTDAALMNIYMRRPDLIKFTTTPLEYDNTSQVTTTPREQIVLTPIVTQEKKKEEEVISTNPMDLYVSKPHFWTFNADYYLQFMQNYVSPNWYKSGSNNYSMLGAVTLEYNYNNKQKVKWNNKLEMKLGFQTTESDTVNNFKTSEDLLRYTTDFGLQAHKNWYYSALLIANSQFCRGLKDNNKKVFSDFLSPLNINLSLGMDYYLETKNKRLKGTFHLAPLAYNFKYVDRLALSKSFGLDEDKHSLHDFGSQVTINLTWEPADMIKWQTRLYAYTTYHKIEAEWENTISFKFNRFISANIFLYPRLDDSQRKKDDNNLIQFKEYLSIGFSYSM